MKCKKHPADASSGVGVCASCLRERLFAIIAVQAQAQALKQAQAQREFRRPDTEPPILFPRSVSPYISRRKSDAGGGTWQPHGHHQGFYSTPQAGPSGSIASGIEKERRARGRERKGRRFSSLFFRIFGSKSAKTGAGPGPIYDPATPIDSSCSVSSPLWFSTDLLSSRRKKNIRTFSIDESKNGCQPRRICRNRDRGMSPVRHSGDENHGRSSGYSSESSQSWRQTPQRTPAQVRRSGGKAAAHGKSVSGFKFCLSPLVRASPTRHWSQKGLPPEMAVAGESRVPTNPYLSAAASFCKNRSRKLADFGRYNYDPNR